MASTRTTLVPTFEYLRSRMDYNPSTGIFIWLPKPGETRAAKAWNAKYAGKRAGSIAKDGYRDIRIDGIMYREHHLAWLYVYGEWPWLGIDHKDRITDHNWIDNLRVATQKENILNSSIRKDNRSGVKGVYWFKTRNRWCSRIQHNGKTNFLGYFYNIEDAAAAYAEASARLHGEFGYAARQP